MGYYGFYIGGTIGFALIAYFLIRGGMHMHRKSNQLGSELFKKYESVVAVWMFVLGVIAICSIFVVLLSSWTD